MRLIDASSARHPIAVLWTLLALAAPVSTMTATALAAPVADQANSSLPVGNFVAIRTGTTASQTFVVGFPGVLDHLDVVVDPRGTPVENLTLEVQATTAGVANGTVLASASLAPFGGTNPTVTFDVSAASLAVAAGDVLALVLKSNATLGNDYLARAVPGNRYGAGQFTDSGGLFGSGAGWDGIFKTFVEPANTPGAGALDQSNTPAPLNNFAAVTSTATATQTFAVGITGTLTRIDLVVDPRNSPPLDLNLEVQATTGGVANGVVLAQAILPPFGGTNPTVSFDVAPYDLQVTQGEVLALVLRTNAAGGTDYLARPVPGDTYAGGEFTNSSGAFATGAGWDAIFETYVETATTGIGPAGPLAGPSLRLAPAMPNPAARDLALRFSLPTSGIVRLSIYDIAGQRVRTLIDGVRGAGDHETRWDLRSAHGARVAPGVYFVSLRAGGQQRTGRVTVIE